MHPHFSGPRPVPPPPHSGEYLQASRETLTCRGGGEIKQAGTALPGSNGTRGAGRPTQFGVHQPRPIGSRNQAGTPHRPMPPRPPPLHSPKASAAPINQSGNYFM